MLNPASEFVPPSAFDLENMFNSMLGVMKGREKTRNSKRERNRKKMR